MMRGIAYEAARRVASIGWLRRSIPRSAYRWAGERMIAKRPDRRYLEGTILPTLAAAGLGPVLFVGCRRYTAH